MHDCKVAIPLLSDVEIKNSNILADRAYGTKKIRSYISEHNADYTIPPKSNNPGPWYCDFWLYKERHLVECFFNKPESVKLKNQISSKVSLQAKNKAKSSHSKCTQKVHENWKTPAFYAIIEVDKSGIGCGKNEL